MRLTDDEESESGDIMMNFYKDPDYDDFMFVWKLRSKLLLTKKQIKYWFWGVYQSQPQFFDNSQEKELNTWMREIERGIRRVNTTPTPELLDCVWALYFATGDEQYPQIIARVAVIGTTDTLRAAATWSYQSIMQCAVPTPANEQPTPVNEQPTLIDVTVDPI
jgi:hypothetical protein